jgi:hypothetical protein
MVFTESATGSAFPPKPNEVSHPLSGPTIRFGYREIDDAEERVKKLLASDAEIGARVLFALRSPEYAAQHITNMLVRELREVLFEKFVEHYLVKTFCQEVAEGIVLGSNVDPWQGPQTRAEIHLGATIFDGT